MNIDTIEISPDEFKEYTGVDLSSRLSNMQEPSAFLKMYQHRLNTFLEATFHRYIEKEYYKGLSEYQQTHYKYAVLEFCWYIFKNGDIGIRSGIDDDGKQIISPEQINESLINIYTKNELIRAGLWTTHLSFSNYDNWWKGV